MIRSMAIFGFGAVLISALCVPALMLQTGETVLGGHYRLGPGETLNEDMNFYFAQVTIQEGAYVDGHIFLYSSTLDLRGHVTEDIHAIESDLNVRESALVGGEIDEKDFIHWTLLLPAAIHLP